MHSPLFWNECYRLILQIRRHLTPFDTNWKKGSGATPLTIRDSALIQLPLRYLVLIHGYKKQGFWSKVGPKPRPNKERGRLHANRPSLYRIIAMRRPNCTFFREAV